MKKRMPFDDETFEMANQYVARKKLEKQKRDMKMQQLVIDHFCKPIKENNGRVRKENQCNR